MIIWLASYPKSGNTLLRKFLSTYFFSKNGTFNFGLLKNIKQYPSADLFRQRGIDVNNKHEVAKSHIKVQEFINYDKKIRFLKTHSSFVKMDGFSFSNLDNTAAVINIVRDPRDVVISYAHHNNQSIEQTVKMINDDYILASNLKDSIPVYMGSWSLNYNSWKVFDEMKKYLLIKYEDLIEDKEKNFTKILHFLKNVTHLDFEIDNKKIKRTLEEISFEKVKKMEEDKGFHEARFDQNGKKIPFFRKGKSNDWKNTLDIKIKDLIESKCKKEMVELGYL